MYYPKRSVYLAGPITGHDQNKAANGWRPQFVEMLGKLDAEHISCFSPMRGKEFLKDFGVLTSGRNYPDHPMCSKSGITVRDFNDLSFCDIMVACFLETPTHKDHDDVQLASLGTGWEFGACYALHKPVIMVADKENIHQHLMLQHSAGYNVTTLEDAVELTYFLLTPGV